MTYAGMDNRFRDRAPKTTQEVKVVVEVRVPEPNAVTTGTEPASDIVYTDLVDLAIAYPVDDRIGFTLTVAGKPQNFEMTRSAAAHFAGRIAEALAK